MSTPPRRAMHLSLTWTSRPALSSQPPAGVDVRPLGLADERALGELMWRAFRGTVDDPGSPEECASDATSAFRARWGPVVWPASAAACADGELVSAVVVVLDDAHADAPLLAFVVTDPVRQREGIGRALIARAAHRLADHGWRELHLAVTQGNPALSLYRQLGFEIVPGQWAAP